MARLVFVFSFMLYTTSLAIPVDQNAHGLGAALSNIAHSFVVVSDDTVKPNQSQVQADEQPPHLESANVLPSLALIALTPEAQIKTETEKLVYTNDTDAQGVVKITIVGTEEVVSSEEESSSESTTTERDEDEHTGKTTLAEEENEPTTHVSSTSKPTTTGASTTTMAAVLTVLGRDQVDKEKEEEIKTNIKEVAAMPVILTVGV